MKKIFPIIASVSLLIIALSFAHYFVIFLPNKEKARQELQKQEIELEKQKLESQRIIEQEKRVTELEKAKTPYDKCLVECRNLFREPKNGVCESSEHIEYDRTGKKICKTNEGACMVICSYLNK